MSDRPFNAPAIAAARRLLARYGVAATYTSLAGLVASGLSRVWFNEDVALQNEGYDSSAPYQIKTIECLTVDLGALDQKGYFAIDSVNYYIIEPLRKDTERILFRVK